MRFVRILVGLLVCLLPAQAASTAIAMPSRQQTAVVASVAVPQRDSQAVVAAKAAVAVKVPLVKSKKPSIKCSKAKGMRETSQKRSARIRLVQRVHFTVSLCTRPYRSGYRQVFALKATPSTGAIRVIAADVSTDPRKVKYNSSTGSVSKYERLENPIPFKSGRCVAIEVEFVAYTANFHTGKIKAYFPCVK